MILYHHIIYSLHGSTDSQYTEGSVRKINYRFKNFKSKSIGFSFFFADDILFFCKANKEECQTILHILKKYELVSGQQINFSKSSLQFGNTVDYTVQKEMKRLLGISMIGGMGSYLSIPESLGGAKTKVFSFVRDRLQDRINR